MAHMYPRSHWQLIATEGGQLSVYAAIENLPLLQEWSHTMCILSALSGLSEFGERNGKVAKELEKRERRVNLIKTHNIHI